MKFAGFQVAYAVLGMKLCSFIYSASCVVPSFYYLFLYLSNICIIHFILASFIQEYSIVIY